MCMGHIVIGGMPTLQYFSTLSHKRYDFRKNNNWKQNVCFDILCNFFWNIRHFKKKREI
jgi:hypothetical protein